ncbi:MAG: alpha-ribazole phosphatase CobZ [Euryarchaeota archaeon]|nr:alpha-ribazole phosphatase CobZ [Euryarchaeota archaeon]
MAVKGAEVLAGRGITLEMLVDACMQMFVPHPGVESRSRARRVLEELIEEALRDANVCILLEAAFMLDEHAESGRLECIASGEHAMDGSALVADEIIGMAIAEYIGGTRALFEFVRFDKAKPGVISELKAFSDDAVAGLLAGVSALMYSLHRR